MLIAILFTLLADRFGWTHADREWLAADDWLEAV